VLVTEPYLASCAERSLDAVDTSRDFRQTVDCSNPESPLYVRLLVVLLLATSLSDKPAFARVFLPTTLDRILLSSDAILVGTVASLAAEAEMDREALVRVQLTAIKVVATRWPNIPADFSFNVATRTSSFEVVRPLEHQPELRVGNRYLLFLRGGDWTEGPFITFSHAIYRIENGTISCPGGRIYGLDVGGLVCSNSDLQWGQAVSEEALVTQLAEYLAASRIRRPRFAGREAAENRVLILYPLRFRDGLDLDDQVLK
jgi:hypothetical protein